MGIRIWDGNGTGWVQEDLKTDRKRIGHVRERFGKVYMGCFQEDRISGTATG